MKFDVFLCHNSKDKKAVRRIGRRLIKAGIKPWLDEWELRPGERWIPELERQIETIGSAAVFVGPDGIGPWQDEEVDGLLREMKKRGRPVIPAILPNCLGEPDLPLFLSNRTWVDFRRRVPKPLAQLVWGITGRKSASGQGHPTIPPHNLPFGSLDDLFWGRADQLAALDPGQDIAGKAPPAIDRVVTGLGGVGKTRLVVEYAWRRGARFSKIFFVSAENEVELGSGVAALAGPDLLDLGCDPALPEADLVKEVRKALREQRNWLLIFDKVDTPAAQSALRKILPLDGGRVLITSRLQHWPVNTALLQLDGLDPDSARDFLLKATQGRQVQADDASSATELAKNLDFLPLALELTAAYVRENILDLSQLLQNWQSEQSLLLDWFNPGAVDYPRSLATTWARSFEKLSVPAQGLLCLLAHLASDSITVAMLEKGEAVLREATDNQLELRAALSELHRYSLITRDGGTLALQRLVQAVARARVAPADRQVWAERAVRLVLAFAPTDPDDVRTWPVWEPLLPHAVRVIELSEENGSSQTAAPLMRLLGLLLLTKAVHRQAEPLLRRALELDEARLGKENKEVADDLNNLARLLQETQRLAEAEEKFRRALAINEALYGGSHPEVAIPLMNLAWLLNMDDRPNQAEQMMRQALEIDEKSFGPSHPRVAIDLNNLGQLLQGRGRLDEAETLMRRALAIDESGPGTPGPKVATRLNNLARLLQATKRWSEAKTKMERSVAILESSLGPDHPKTRKAKSNHANLLAEMESAGSTGPPSP